MALLKREVEPHAEVADVFPEELPVGRWAIVELGEKCEQARRMMLLVLPVRDLYTGARAPGQLPFLLLGRLQVERSDQAGSQSRLRPGVCHQRF